MDEVRKSRALAFWSSRERRCAGSFGSFVRPCWALTSCWACREHDLWGMVCRWWVGKREREMKVIKANLAIDETSTHFMIKSVLLLIGLWLLKSAPLIRCLPLPLTFTFTPSSLDSQSRKSSSLSDCSSMCDWIGGEEINSYNGINIFSLIRLYVLLGLACNIYEKRKKLRFS